MIKPNFRTSISSTTPQSRVPTSRSTPRPLVSFQPLADGRPSSSSSSTRLGDSSVRPTPTASRPDPLFNFRADASRPPSRPKSQIAPMTSEDDMQGIEDITESQWEACPPGRSDNGRSSSVMGGARDSYDDRTRWEGEGESSTRKRKGLHEREGSSSALKFHRPGRYLLSPSSSPAVARSIKKSSPVSQSGKGEDLDMYSMSLVDDETPESAQANQQKAKGGKSGNFSEEEAEHSTKSGSEDGDGSQAEDEEEEAATSQRSSSPFLDSHTTPNVDKGDEDAVQWSPSPLSPRSMARRTRSSSSANPNRNRVSETPPFINDSQVEDGEAGPSSPPSARSRSTSRKAAVAARARSKHFIVLSDNEDDDYDPFNGGDEDAFTKEYKRQVEQEANEPEETDGSDGDDDMGEEKSDGNEPESFGGEEEDDFFVLASQQPPPPKSTSKKPVKTTITFNNQAQAGPSRIPWQPPQPKSGPKLPAPVDHADEYDDLPTNFFDDVDLDEISHSNPSNNSQSGPAPQLNTLFSASSPKGPRPTSNAPTTSHSNSTSRVPLGDLPSVNIRPPAPRPSGGRKSLLHLIEDDDLGANNAQADEPEEELGYMPVSKMPARWRDFYMNHWRRGADKSKITNAPMDEAEEVDDEPVSAPAAKKAGRATKSARGAAAGSRGRGASKAGGRSVVRDDEEGQEDDYEGDLGGPGAPPKSSSSGRGWYGRGRGRGGLKRGGGGRKKAVARRR